MMKTQALKSVVFAAIAAGLSSVGLAADYWASPTGSGTGTSKDDPTSLAAALAIAAENDGTVIHLTEGDFPVAATEQILLENDTQLLGVSSNKTALVCSGNRANSAVKLTHEGAVVSDLTIKNASVTSSHGGGVYMTAGTVRNCRITGCVLWSSPSKYGGGIYLTGGLVTGCTIDNCHTDKTYDLGNAVYFGGTAGVVHNCDIFSCNNGYSNSNPDAGSAIVLFGSTSKTSTATLSSCRIHNNSKETIAGVFQRSGLMVNCAIYENTSTKYLSAGIYKTGGETYYCTVYGNVLTGDSSGKSGLIQTDGVTKNCIFYGNGPAASTAGSCSVTGGTFENNVVDNESILAAYPSNFVGDPQFVDAANADFHIANADSSALKTGAAAIDGCAYDIDGVERDASHPTAGCYEFVKGEVDVSIVFEGDSEVWSGTPVVASAAVTGGSIDDFTYEWYLDGVLSSSEPTFVMNNLGLLSHSLRLVATGKDGGEPIEKELKDCILVHPKRVYVGLNGNGTYPYATPETATNSFAEAMASLWDDGKETPEVVVCSGTYEIASQIAVTRRMKLTGEDRERTCISYPAGRAIRVGNSGATVSALTVTNSAYGISITSGTVQDCRIVDCVDSNATTAEQSGGGLYLAGGQAIGCEVERCQIWKSSYAAGAGIYATGQAVVSNCLVRGCVVTSGKGSFAKAHGVYLYNGARLTHSTVVGNGDDSHAMRSDDGGGAIFAQLSAVVEWCDIRENHSKGSATIYADASTFRNCLMADNVGGGVNVRISGSTLVNCTIAGSCESATSVSVSGTSKIYNSILSTTAGGYTLGENVVAEHSCCPALEEGVNGNTAKDPKFKSVARGDYRLKGGSPCIDAGDNAQWEGFADPLDLDCEQRIRYGAVDMGCYENRRVGLVLILL